ncbi:MAG: NADH-quinone oxidoreductase subunit NuoK [Candidatus Omnitrophica bacterium]|jgi:NADH-quinone oxidoreductase subunit K|nr:NADH-quinone oxidoreductase subunit NuoK [Candidatus Omnitrophota bacterium]
MTIPAACPVSAVCLQVGLHHYLTVSAILFAIGLYGLLTRRNILLILLSIELILNGANLSFVAFSSYWGNLTGQVLVFFTMIVAAAEVTVGLAIVVLLFRKKKTVSVDDLDTLKW